MPEKQQFDPRRAALYHAGRAKAPTTLNPDLSDLASGIACGLIYVGDQLKAANEQREATNGYLSAIANLLNEIDKTVNDRLIDVAEAV